MLTGGVKTRLEKIPLLSSKYGPEDKGGWEERLKQEYTSLIAFIEFCRDSESDWFEIDSDELGLVWKGKCWSFFELQRFEFDFEIEIPRGYPATPVEICLPQLDGKTPKMYRGGKICLDVHFKPLWTRNFPRFGLAHALALGLAPWLAAEVPILAEAGLILPHSSEAKES